MKTEICNIWDKHKEGNLVCITTNGFVTQNGLAVCGRGVAAQAAKKYPSFKRALADAVMKNGNVVQRVIGTLVSFPVKPVAGICRPDKTNVVKHMRNKFGPYSYVPGWAMMADIHLIEWGLVQLNYMHIAGMFDKIYLPKPGCGAGGLSWYDVEPFCRQWGDWLIVCDLKG